jgi:RimJ/RimL family protein N-acetyltransferase
MRLVDVYTEPESNDFLWRLLAQRPQQANISHRKMPTWQEHCDFVDSRPYLYWYLIDCGDYVGAVYLSKQREIGIGVLAQFWGHGYGKSAIQMLMAKHPGKFLANVAPGNRVSIELFADMGFRHIQNTYEIA